MPTITLKNPNIKQKETSTFKTYYLIKDPNNSDNAFFAFERSLSHFNKWRQWTVKDGWQELVNNYQNIKELEIEYYENEQYKKVISIYIPQKGEVFI